jgi:histidine triad (HIT) family protein
MNNASTWVDDCLFCRIIRQDIPATIAYQTTRVTAFHDVNPQAPTHLLLVSHTHTASHQETSDPQVFSDLHQAAQTVARQLGLTDYRLVINNGAGAGQSVFHLHLHLLAGRAFSWPPG